MRLLSVVGQVFSTATVTAYGIASRSAELITNRFDEGYSGWIMID
ncbi:MAG: hypothetical protein ACRERS_07725 [Methylococcales bacterium]